MKIKRFQALTMQEALRSVKAELGPDAVVLSTQQVKNGGAMFGMFERPLIEVTAAIDAGTQDIDVPTASQKPTFEKHLATASVFAPLQQDLALIREEIQSLKRATVGLEGNARRDGGPASATLPVQWKELRDEMYELRLLVQTFTNSTRAVEGIPVSQAHREQLSPLLEREYQKLMLQGVDPAVVQKVMTFMSQKLSEAQLAQPKVVQAYMDDLLACTVKVAGPLWERPGSQKVVLFVGATGVGKTTTLAKLAAQYREKEDCKIAVATLDTHRVGAIEQLKMYTRVLGLPVEMAMSPRELTQLVQRHKKKDLVLIDSAGRSPADLAGLGELKELCDADVPFEIHLVLAGFDKAEGPG